MFSWLLFLGLTPHSPAESAAPARYAGYREVVVEPTSAAQAQAASLLPGRRLGCLPQDYGALHLLLAPGEQASLDASGIGYTVAVDDAQFAWDSARMRRQQRRAGGARADFFADFKAIDEIETFLSELVSAAPDRVQAIEVGKSFDGATIRGLRITNGHGDTDNPVFLVIGTQHAREWLSTMSVLWYANHLVNDYFADTEVASLVDAMDFVIVPVVNPDGFAYTWDGDRYWRKNRRGGYGVDLNRNWDAGWGTGNGSAGMNEEIYPGSGAFSEPESQAIADYAQGIDNLVGFVDVHTPIASVLYPRSYTTQEPDHIAELTEWASEAAEAIGAVHGEAHDVFRPSGPGDPTGMGPQGGLGMDYMTDQGHYGWIFELRGPDFQIDASEIVPAAQESWAGLATLAQHLIEKFGNDSGGDDDDDSTTATSSGNETSSSASSSSDDDDDADDDEDAEDEDEASTDHTTPSDTTNDTSNGVTTASSDDDDDTSSEASDDGANAAGSGGGCASVAPPQIGWLAWVFVALGLRRYSKRMCVAQVRE